MYGQALQYLAVGNYKDLENTIMDMIKIRKGGKEKGLYKYNFQVPSDWKGKIINIVFEGSMTDTEVKINGQSAR